MNKFCSPWIAFYCSPEFNWHTSRSWIQHQKHYKLLQILKHYNNQINLFALQLQINIHYIIKLTTVNNSEITIMENVVIMRTGSFHKISSVDLSSFFSGHPSDSCSCKSIIFFCCFSKFMASSLLALFLSFSVIKQQGLPR